MWHLACLLCFGIVLIVFVYWTSACVGVKILVPWQHQYTPTVSEGSVSDRQADRRTALWAWEGQMFPCRHRGEMFAMPDLCLPGSPQSHQLAAQCPELAGVCWGKNWGQRGSRTYTGDKGETANVLCAARGKRNTSRTTVSVGERSLLFLGCPVDARGDSFGLAGGQTECQSCHGGGWPYQPSIDTGWRRISFYRTCTQRGSASACSVRHLFFMYMAALSVIHSTINWTNVPP